MVKVVLEGSSCDSVGTNPENIPPERGWQGSAKLDSTTEWFWQNVSVELTLGQASVNDFTLAKKVYVIVSPTLASIVSGSNFNPPLPTATVW